MTIYSKYRFEKFMEENDGHWFEIEDGHSINLNNILYFRIEMIFEEEELEVK